MRPSHIAILVLPALGAACATTTLSFSPSSSEPSAPRLERRSVQDPGNGVFHHFIYLPEGYDSEVRQRWPVLFFLHGNGERGDREEDLDYVLVHGPLYEVWIQKRHLPFVIVAPQLPLFGLDASVEYLRDRSPADIPRRLEEGVPPRPQEFPTPEPMSPVKADASLPHGPQGPAHGWFTREKQLLALIEQIEREYRVDSDRFYLTGLSYGGFGTWYIASRYPDRFAAIAPVAGWGHPDLMSSLAGQRVPIWAFAGGRDAVVPLRYFYAGLNDLERLGHTEIRFTIHEDVGHDVWRRVYASQDLYDWLLEHDLTSTKRSTAPGD